MYFKPFFTLKTDKLLLIIVIKFWVFLHFVILIYKFFDLACWSYFNISRSKVQLLWYLSPQADFHLPLDVDARMLRNSSLAIREQWRTIFIRRKHLLYTVNLKNKMNSLTSRFCFKVLPKARGRPMLAISCASSSNSSSSSVSSSRSVWTAAQQ